MVSSHYSMWAVIIYESFVCIEFLINYLLLSCFSIILLFSGVKERETEECCCNKGTARKG
jgi:hypothetical protein